MTVRRGTGGREAFRQGVLLVMYMVATAGISFDLASLYADSALIAGPYCVLVAGVAILPLVLWRVWTSRPAGWRGGPPVRFVWPSAALVAANDVVYCHHRYTGVVAVAAVVLWLLGDAYGFALQYFLGRRLFGGEEAGARPAVRRARRPGLRRTGP